MVLSPPLSPIGPLQRFWSYTTKTRTWYVRHVLLSAACSKSQPVSQTYRAWKFSYTSYIYTIIMSYQPGHILVHALNFISGTFTDSPAMLHFFIVPLQTYTYKSFALKICISSMQTFLTMHPCSQNCMCHNSSPLIYQKSFVTAQVNNKPQNNLT